MPYSYPFLTAKTISFIEALGMEFKTAMFSYYRATIKMDFEIIFKLNYK